MFEGKGTSVRLQLPESTLAPSSGVMYRQDHRERKTLQCGLCPGQWLEQNQVLAPLAQASPSRSGLPIH